MGKPNIASLSLNLDGCRFGDEFRHTRQTTENKQQQFDSKQQQNKVNSNQLENSHPNQPDIQQNTQLGSPLSTYHYNHQPQYTTLPSHHHPSHQNNLEPPSPLGNTYRHEGLSIGINFLRCNGINNSTLCIDDLIIEDCVGRGVCSSVWKARRKTPSIDNNNRKVECVDDVVNGIQNIELEDNKKDCNTANVQNIELQQSSSTATATYALKIFPLHDPTKRSMLIRELKLLCTFKCDCLVELEGAFLDNDNGSGSGGYGNNVTLVLEYMDCGSLVDLMSSSRSNNVDNDNVEDIIGSPNQDDVKTSLPTTPGTPLFCNLSPPTSDNGKHRKVPEYAVAAIAYQILWGICYLHYEGVLHRDIKVSTISVRCLELGASLSRFYIAAANYFLTQQHF